MCVLSTKVPIWKKSGNLFNDPPSNLLKVIIIPYFKSYNFKLFVLRIVSWYYHCLLKIVIIRYLKAYKWVLTIDFLIIL